MPVLLSSYPSSQIWSRYDYGNLQQDFSSFNYRMASYNSYIENLWTMYKTKKEFKEVLGPLKRYLVDRDQDTALILG